MDAYEATRVVFSRIQSLDPDNAAKIMGLLLIQDHGDKDMIRLAFGPDSLLQTLVLKCRKDLGIVSPSPPVAPFLVRQTSTPRLSPISNSFAPAPFSRTASCNGRELNVSISDEVLGQSFPPLYDEGLGEDWHHRRSCSAGDPGEGAGWRPCLYFARGYCKNGGSCRFVHGGAPDDCAVGIPKTDSIEQEMLLQRARSRYGAGFPGALSPPSPTAINFLLQQESQRAAAAAAAALMLGGEEVRSFMGRPRMERGEFAGMLNPGSRQIYLTFPADSTFREEDVSNYFSIYGPVQDVRIPYQQKRMFGFVTFVYPETVKLILAKGNPHFVCDARVLVKPYKEKGKVPDKFRKQPHPFDMGDLASPTALDDPYDLQGLTARFLYNRRKLELQQAIEMQGRRFADLHLDLEGHGISSPTSALNGVVSTPEQSSPEDMSPSPAAAAALSVSQAATRVLNAGSANGMLRRVAVNGESNEDSSNVQQSAEHNLPESPFASPRKEFSGAGSFSSTSSGSEAEAAAVSPHSDSSSSGNLASAVDATPFKSCFLEVPRFSATQGTVGL